MAAYRPVSRKAEATALFDLKSTSLPVLALLLRTVDLDALTAQMQQRYGDSPGLFEHEPLCIDLAGLRELDEAPAPDFVRLLALLRGLGFNPVAVRGGLPLHMAAGLAAGLAEAPDAAGPSPAPEASAAPAAVPQADNSSLPASAAPALPPTEVAPAGPAPSALGGTLIIDRPVRSGQRIYARGGDLIVLGMVNAGAEVVADGSVHVYAPLRGRAVAGVLGDTRARVFSTCMQAQLISIAGLWKTAEDGWPAGLQGQPAQARLEGERLVLEVIKG
ncbi:septum site-determining protein MinC [Ideonella livida]|uniref:Probable septum site-determining protein MinC n=1 Tax=Ideonella livida TaxID=2707176 RepID=A0A7C9TJB5_9BURK|nr:septum site-determining protein MinC [Ideonella livida]NDY91638.1 septum site-determining protein MinC [Ideonella livida]